MFLVSSVLGRVATDATATILFSSLLDVCERLVELEHGIACSGEQTLVQHARVWRSHPFFCEFGVVGENPGRNPKFVTETEL